HCSSSMTSACASYPPPPPKNYSRSYCAVMNEPAHCSLQTDPSKTGANCSAIPPPSPRCWTDSFIMATCSSAAPEAGEPKRSYLKPLSMRKRNKEGGSFDGFIALCQYRSRFVSENQTGHLATPRFGLGPWVGARVAYQQCPILRPGRSAF